MFSQPIDETVFETYSKPWKRYAQFSGRASRKEYWTFSLVNAGIYIVLGVIVPLMLGAGDPSRTPNPIAMFAQLIYFVFAVAAFIPSLSVAVRRLHDTDRSGWWLIPCMICGLILLVFGLQEGDHGPNQYGPDPYDEGTLDPRSLTPPPPSIYEDLNVPRPMETWRKNDGE
jgi:uncharacterized membrane protein YhaH (DUF805 family)